jgi:hypothetical protein
MTLRFAPVSLRVVASFALAVFGTADLSEIPSFSETFYGPRRT